MFRGNVETRLRRIADGEATATLLALAGLHRLGRGDVAHPIAAEEMLPAAGQGVIALECRTDDGALPAGVDAALQLVFGTDPRRSVLDPLCRTHDVENLFVVDASFFPSSAAVNPA